MKTFYVKKKALNVPLTSPNLDPQASLFPQNTQVSHRQGPSLPVHMALQASQHSLEVLNLNSDPHFTAVPHSSKFSIPWQHSPISLSFIDVIESRSALKVASLDLMIKERNV